MKIRTCPKCGSHEISIQFYPRYYNDYKHDGYEAKCSDCGAYNADLEPLESDAVAEMDYHDNKRKDMIFQTKIRITDVKWDTDGESVDIPTEIEANLEEVIPDIDDIVSEWLSDRFGFCHEGFSYTIEKYPIDNADGK